jgi:hypothetical protein
MVDPPLLGACHLIVTLLPPSVVVGASGVSGICAARIATVFEKPVRFPLELIALTLNWYSTP